MLTINVDPATLSIQLPAYQGKGWQRSYPQCISQWLAYITGAMCSGKTDFFDELDNYERW